MFNMLRAHLPKGKGEELVGLAEKLFEACCMDGLLSDSVLKAALNCLPPSSTHKLIGPKSKKKTISVRDLPVEWRRFVTVRGR
jgi:hypothetical protein